MDFNLFRLIWNIAEGIGRLIEWTARWYTAARAHLMVYGIAIAAGAVTGDIVSVSFSIAKSAATFALNAFLALLNATAIPVIGNGEPVTWESIRSPLARLFATGADILGALGCPVHPADFAAYLIGTLTAGLALGLLWMVSRKMLGIGG